MKDLFAELTSGDDERAEQAIPAIVDAGAAAIPALLELTYSENTDTRWWAVRALAASPHTQTSDLISTLSDSSPEVRAAAALALSQHPGEEAVSALAQNLRDSDPLAAGLAANALVKIGKAAVPSLIEAAKDGEQGIRILALRALSELRDHRAIPVMMQCIQEDSAVLGYWAQMGLERLGLDMVYIKP
ncbi:MAG TPA: HEAT repeat domain-containing protein [Anaerolineales bacterium]|nr:HEAT repeat domain-containing protein [Anaerolineales bacterium]HNB42466.1 HEAT repeat domain-containing protein [Anaerolineales bacterium]